MDFFLRVQGQLPTLMLQVKEVKLSNLHVSGKTLRFYILLFRAAGAGFKVSLSDKYMFCVSTSRCIYDMI